MNRNFKLTIEYDGTTYFGWQRQVDPNTVQGTIERAVETLTGQPAILTGSGRTDAGVHAMGQVANVHVDTRLSPTVIRRALNALLPRDIAVLSCEEVPADFHARFDAIGKHYRYRIVNRPVAPAVGRQYAWHIPRTLNMQRMTAALAHLTGVHDFKAFEGAGSPRAHTVRNVRHATFDPAPPDEVHFSIEADGFLRHMVRNIVGTLVDVGLERLSPDDVAHIRASGDRRRAGATAPAQGLFLVAVHYPA